MSTDVSFNWRLKGLYSDSDTAQQPHTKWAWHTCNPWVYNSNVHSCIAIRNSIVLERRGHRTWF